MLGYNGKFSVLFPINRYNKNRNKLMEPISFPSDTKNLHSWRSTSIDRKRLIAIKELAGYLNDDLDLDTVAGPVLSGALFAQAIADNSSLRAYYINKTVNCGPKKHAYKVLVRNWVFVDDIIERGSSLRRVAKEIDIIPKAIIVFTILFPIATIPEVWKNVPVFTLRGIDERK